MTVYDQPKTTYSDSTPHKRIITDIISLIDPSDAPLIDALGGLDGASGKFRFTNGKGKVVEWLEDSLIPLTDLLASGATVTSTIVTLSVNDGSLYQPGHIIMVSTEYMWVSSVSGNTITVTRGAGGSTAATQTSVAAVSFVGMARLEGAESDTIGLVDITTGSNFTQIFHQEVKVSRTQQQLSQYGISDEMAYQGDKAIPSLMRLIERHLFYNKAASAGSATTPRVMGGLQSFITGNLVAGTSLTQAMIESAAMLAYQDGGTGPWIAPVAPANMTKIKNFYDATTVLRVDRSESTVGMVITQIETPFGQVNLVLDRWAPTTLIPLIDVKHAGMLTYYPFTQEPLAKTGDYERSEVVGEFTFCLRQDNAHALLTAVS
jgi:hypothetical protein